MKKSNNIKSLVISAMFLALAFVMPFLTGQIPQIGCMLCPMHIPVILCGYICGAPWGLAVGIIAPLLRSAIMGMPVMFPVAISMAFELAVYGFMSGLLYRCLPRKKWCIYLSLVISMLAGRLVWGFVQLCCVSFNVSAFGISAFWAGAVANAVPGIIIQLIFIPLIIMTVQKQNKDY